MNSQYLHSSYFVRKGDLNLSIDSTWSEKGWIESIRLCHIRQRGKEGEGTREERGTYSIRREDYFRFTEVVESVQLIQQLHQHVSQRKKRMEEYRRKEERIRKTNLHQSPLNLPISTSPLTKPPSPNRINLIHENNTRFMFLCVGKHFSN